VFTGIVEELGRVVSCDGQRLRTEAQTVLVDTHLGDSIAVNGACLTVVDIGAGWWEADVTEETLLRTNIGGLAPGDPVNLERPMRLEDRLGGHLVLGHVDGVGEIVSPSPDLVVRISSDLMRYCVEKGSITVDGVSLTSFGLGPDTFRVSIIPHTAAVTTLGYKGTGARVNIEVDVLAKHVERLVEPFLRDRT
jgi:riboflavin synthase